MIFAVIPGADKVNASEAVKKDLCSLCLNGTCGVSDENAYLGYVGAFKCMEDGKNRVGFVKQTTADDYIKKYGGKKEDYKLLCRDGETKCEWDGTISAKNRIYLTP